jgi:DNA-binding response OmpR family regulator
LLFNNDVMIMVVEQDPYARASLSDLLSDRGHRVIQAADAIEAIRCIEENPGLELILLDLEIAGSARVLKFTRRMAPHPMVLGMSRNGAVPEVLGSVQGAVLYKPLVFEELYREICAAGVRADRCKL